MIDDLRLSWMRDEDGVIVVYATDPAGRKCEVADIWTGPLREELWIESILAQMFQQRIAETLVENWNGPGEADP